MPINLNDAGPQQGNHDLLPAGPYHFGAIVIPGGAGLDGFLRREKKNPRVLMMEVECKVTDGDYANRRVWDYIPVEIDQSTDGNLAPIPADQLSKIQSRVRRGRAKLRALLDSAFELQPNDDSDAAQKKRELDSYGAVHGLKFYAQVGASWQRRLRTIQPHRLHHHSRSAGLPTATDNRGDEHGGAA